ncbi:MAG: SMC family ATPase [Euryarchaeota archaeon]|nr:SMC family ATPase [Euryarchaeota archaeon]
MRLRLVHIQNFRKYEDARLEFPDGLIALVGRNGAGKSTVIEAVGWCLFGNEAARTNKEYVKRRGAAPSQDCRVTLQFEANGHVYEVMRELAGTSLAHSAYLIADDKPVVQPGPNSAKEVTDYVGKALKLDRESFFTSIVARQKELNALSDMTPGKRREAILRMLDIDALDEAVKSVREEKRALVQEADVLRASAKNVTDLRSRAAEFAEAKTRSEAELELIEEELSGLKQELDQLLVRREDLRRKGEAFSEVSSKIERREEKLTVWEQQLAEKRADIVRLGEAESALKEIAPRNAEFLQSRERLVQLERAREKQKEWQTRTEELVGLRSEGERVTRRLAEVEARRHQLAEARRHLNHSVEELRRLGTEWLEIGRDIHGIEVSVQRLNEQANTIKTHREAIARLGTESPCPTCERSLGPDHHDALVAKYAAQLLEFEGKAAEMWATHRLRKEDHARLQERIRHMETEVARFTLEAQELAVMDGEAARLGEDSKRLRERIMGREVITNDLEEQVKAAGFNEEEHVRLRTVVSELEAVHDRFVALTNEVSRRTQAKEDESILVEGIDGLKEALSELYARRNAIGFDRAVFESVGRSCDEKQGLYRVRSLDAQKKGSDIERIGVESRLVADSIAEQEALASRIAEREEAVRYLERLAGDRDSGLLIDFRGHLIARIRPALSHHASEVFRVLTDGKYTGLELDENYDITVYDEGVPFGLTRFSGGEADLANLSLRLAISQVIAERAGGELNFIALDEVFGSQDDSRRQNILRSLKGLANRFRQIVLITHIEDVKEGAEHVIRAVEASDGRSQVGFEEAAQESIRAEFAPVLMQRPA